MAATEQSDESRRVLSWLFVEIVMLLIALIGLLTLFAKENVETWIYVVFGVALVLAVAVLPAWAVWGLSDETEQSH